MIESHIKRLLEHRVVDECRLNSHSLTRSTQSIVLTCDHQGVWSQNRDEVRIGHKLQIDRGTPSRVIVRIWVGQVDREFIRGTLGQGDLKRLKGITLQLNRLIVADAVVRDWQNTAQGIVQVVELEAKKVA